MQNNRKSNYSSCFASRRNQPNQQQELFSMLKKKQQKALAEILRDLKPQAQGQLCQRLLDYMETGQMLMTNSFVVDSLLIYIISPCEDPILPERNPSKHP